VTDSPKSARAQENLAPYLNPRRGSGDPFLRKLLIVLLSQGGPSVKEVENGGIQHKIPTPF